MVPVYSLKTWLVLLVLVVAPVAVAFTLVEADVPPELCEEQDCKKHKVHIATGQSGGTYYNIGRALTVALRKQHGEEYIAFVETAGSEENLDVVTDTNYPGDWFGIVQSDVIDYRYGRENYDKFKIVGAICREPVYIIVRRKLHVSSIQDLRGKKVAVGLEKSGTQHTSRTILEIFGISLDEVNEVPLEELAVRGKDSYYAETAKLLEKGQEEGRIDAAFIVNARIPKKIEECIKSCKAYILKISRSDLAKIASTDPHLYRLSEATDPHLYRLSEATDPADKKKFTTIAVTAVLIAHPNTEGQIVRNLAEQLCTREYRQYLKDINSSSTESNEIDWMDPPFVIYGKKDEALFNEYYRSSYGRWEYELRGLISYWFPLVLLVLCICIVLKRCTWKGRLGRSTLAIWFYFYLLAVCTGYLFMVVFESNTGNPDITGSPKDLLNIFRPAIGLGEMFCVTLWGGIVKTLMLIISGAFITVIVWRVGFHVIDDKIREVLKMVPRHNQDHVVICNWTSKIPLVIRELRSPTIQNKKRIIIVAQRNDKSQSDIESLRTKYDDVYICAGDPADGDTLISDTVNIRKAHAILILADNDNPDEADIKSIKILCLVTGLLKNFGERPGEKQQEKPRVVVELLDAALRNSIEGAGPDKVICYPDLTHKLLAQAIITPGAVDFVH